MLINFTSYKNIGLIFLICTACLSTIKPIEDNDFKNQIQNCPEGWGCSFEFLKNKSAKIELDKFNNSFLTLIDSKSNVLKFKYFRNHIPGTADSGYDEVIILNIDNLLQNNINLTEKGLWQRLMLYLDECVCIIEKLVISPSEMAI